MDLKPDLVIVYDTQTDLKHQLDRARIPMFRYVHRGLPDITETLRMLGDRTLVDIEIGGQRVVVKAAPTTNFKTGEKVRAAIDLDRVHLFDADTESAIPRRA